MSLAMLRSYLCVTTERGVRGSLLSTPGALACRFPLLSSSTSRASLPFSPRTFLPGTRALSAGMRARSYCVVFGLTAAEPLS